MNRTDVMHRRHFLRGLGTCTALPAMESLMPNTWAHTGTAGVGGRPLRMAFVEQFGYFVETLATIPDGDGNLRPGRHVDAKGKPMCNLYVSMLERMGRQRRFLRRQHRRLARHLKGVMAFVCFRVFRGPPLGLGWRERGAREKTRKKD